MPLVSVITPFSRGLKELTTLMRDFKNQTFPDFEHLIINDGPIQPEIQSYIREHQNDYNVRFCAIKKDLGDMKASPGTAPRNYGVSIAEGKFCCFVDDDDRVKDQYLEKLLYGMINESTISVVQIVVAQSRIYKDGDPKKIVFIPEVGLPTFPMMGHVSTQSFMCPTDWVRQEKWLYEPEHDIRLLRRLIKRYKPTIHINNSVQADLDGLLTKGIKDWVSVPPFFRG